jgi:hypothetical protein
MVVMTSIERSARRCIFIGSICRIGVVTTFDLEVDQ